jgi:hypothetical protein
MVLSGVSGIGVPEVLSALRASITGTRHAESAPKVAEYQP